MKGVLSIYSNNKHFSFKFFSYFVVFNIYIYILFMNDLLSYDNYFKVKQFDRLDWPKWLTIWKPVRHKLAVYVLHSTPEHLTVRQFLPRD